MNKGVERFEQALKRRVARSPPEQRLAGLSPEQRRSSGSLRRAPGSGAVSARLEPLAR